MNITEWKEGSTTLPVKDQQAWKHHAPNGSGGMGMQVSSYRQLLIDEGVTSMEDGEISISGKRLIDILIKATDTIFPELMQCFYPRRYEGLGNYHSPKVTAAFLTEQIASVCGLEEGFFEAPTATRLMMPALWYMMQRRMPYMFIAPNLLDAIKLTDYEGDIDWAVMKLPYEHGIFILPRGTLTHQKDGEVSAILYSRCFPGDYLPPVKHPKIPIFVIEEAHFCAVALCADKGIWYDFNVTGSKRPIVRFNNIFYTTTADGSPKPDLPTYTSLDHNLTEEDSQFVEKLGILTFGTLLAMQARPQLLTQEKLLRKVRDKKTGGTREWWEPNIVGKFYRMKGLAAGQGTHASPRDHFVRGHRKQQVHGPRNSLRKEIWIEPYAVGFKEKESEP